MNYIVEIQVGDYFINCEMANGRTYHYDLHFLLDKSEKSLILLRILNFLKKFFLNQVP